MPANNSDQEPAIAGQEAFAPKCGCPSCELAMHNLAINPRVSIAIKINNQLCTTCSLKLRELLTSVGISH
jgi:hypothetical protein